MANGFDLNSRVSRIRVTASGFDQLDTLAVAVIFVRFFVYLIAAAFIHDYSEKLVYSAAFTEVVVIAFTLIYTLKRDKLMSCFVRLATQVLLAGAAIGVIYVNGIITTYLTEVQKRESIIVLLVIFNVLFVVAEAAQALFSIDVFLAASTSRHRKSGSGEFKTRIKPKNQLIGMTVCFLILVIPAYLSGIIVSGLDNVKVDTRVYQVVQSEYVLYEYPATARKRGSGCILGYGDDKELNLDETPLYYGQDGSPDKIMMSKAYAVVEPSIGSTKKIDTLSMIEPVRDGVFLISSEGKEREATNFFLWDSKDLYVFFDELTLNIDDKTIKTSPYTYIKATYNGSINIFDPQKASVLNYSLIGRDVYATLRDGTKIDLGNDMVYRVDGSEQMLVAQIQNLDVYVG